MSLPPTATTDWASIREEYQNHLAVLEETQAPLSPDEQRRFTRLFLAFTWYPPPSVPETQAELRLIFTFYPVLLSMYSSFLTHPVTTPAECEAARAELHRILHFPMLDVRAIEDTAAADSTWDTVSARFPTRQALLELLKSDEECGESFNIAWPEDQGNWLSQTKRSSD